MAEIDGRKRMILHAIVVEYVSTAEPVGSEALVSRYPLGVKSATVRNEMSELLDLGLIEQPHTSAGRIPSDLGYRFYVDRLVITNEIDTAVQERLRTAAGDGEALQTVLRDTARLLSRMTNLLGVATTIREPNLEIRTAVVSALGPNQMLFVVALSNGHIENRMIEVPADLTLEHIGLANDALARGLVGTSLRLSAQSKPPASAGHPIADKVLALAWAQLRVIAKNYSRGSVIVEGEEQLLTQPEFKRDIDSFSGLMSELTNSDLLYQGLAQNANQVVTIGRENARAELQQFSIVRQSYYVGDTETGMVAVVGPTRMRYDESIPLVNFTAATLSASLTRFLGR